MPNNLRRLLASNARRGSFRAEGNTLYVYDVIVASEADAEWFGGVSAEAIVKALRDMSGPVALRINSPGGDVFAARAIQAAMDAYDGEIVAYVDGVAASAASLIAAAASRCVMSSGAFMMIHKAWTIALGNAEDMLATAELLEKIDGSLAETYADKTSKDAGRYAQLMAAETWFTAAEAVAEGLADAIAEKASAKAQAWDLSAYQRPPEAPAPEATAAPEAVTAAPAADEDHARRVRQHAARVRSRAA